MIPRRGPKTSWRGPSRALLDAGPYIRHGIIVHLNGAAETCRTAIIDELKKFPEWVEARIAAANPALQRTIMKYINAVAFVFGNLASTLHDRVLSGIAEAASIARAKWLARHPTLLRSPSAAWLASAGAPESDDSWIVDDS